MLGNGVAPGNTGDPRDPDPNIVNVFRDISFGLKQANLEYDQLNVFDTLTLEGETRLLIELLGGFTPEEGDFFDLLTADQINLNGSLILDAPVINDLTFGYEILTLFDPGAGFDRQVVRVSYGFQAVPEPTSLWLLGSLSAAFLIPRRRRRC